jgi:hypothetical protein
VAERGGLVREEARVVTEGSPPSGRRPVRPVLLLVLVLVASSVGVAWGRTLGGEPVVGHPGISGFRQSAEVDRDRYEDQEAVVLTYRVCRSRPWPARTNAPPMEGGVAAEFRVVAADADVVADTTHRGYVLVLSSTWWWPGQCRAVDLEWDQHRWNQEDPEGGSPDTIGSPVRGGRVEPGEHRFEVWWHVSAGGEPDEQLPAPVVTAPFLIEP